MNKHTNKIVQFATALSDCYKDDENRESGAFPEMELSDDELTDDFVAMLEAQLLLYKKLTGDEQDLLGFTHILNRLAFQHIVENLNKSEVKDSE